MSRIRGKGNKDTEIVLAKLLRAEGIRGWRRQQKVSLQQSAVSLQQSGGGRGKVRIEGGRPKTEDRWGRAETTEILRQAQDDRRCGKREQINIQPATGGQASNAKRSILLRRTSVQGEGGGGTADGRDARATRERREL